MSNVRILKQHLLSDNWYVLKKIDFELQRRDGSWQPQTREVYDRGNGATIGLYNRARRTVILTRQFRIPAFVNEHHGYLIEAAAGLLDNASPEERIRAEAEEETGYRVRSVRKIFDAFMSPGSVTERVHFFVGEYQPEDRINDGGGLAEEGEDIEVLELPFAEALAMVDDGRIMDGKTIILLQYLKALMPTAPQMILIAGADDEVNKSAARLLQTGHLPVTATWPTQGDSPVGAERYGQLLLSRCDALLRVAGPSSQADRLVALAKEKGLVVYREVDEIIGQTLS
ncbi:nudix-type nucleoside diphosphatase (YffH/AdpP family) [Pseudomonas sp. URMO17WK12:I1]|uniref:NUDIX domain-containing protein n=1 Tax=unclassified Pseudomonas TaxID=196821 RepID=UPI000487CFD0|nr:MULTISPECIES: NUDIX domain-containing protein [unclassified Pseudomonas]PZW68684.1 nudix-type nucleoside diphosphatase (YffH/AdpP family) [Pseudomonas sp. URMO17WK12:I1]